MHSGASTRVGRSGGAGVYAEERRHSFGIGLASDEKDGFLTSGSDLALSWAHTTFSLYARGIRAIFKRIIHPLQLRLVLCQSLSCPEIMTIKTNHHGSSRNAHRTFIIIAVVSLKPHDEATIRDHRRHPVVHDLSPALPPCHACFES